jgi:DNA-binding Lrp family transcriptional regulator
VARLSAVYEGDRQEAQGPQWTVRRRIVKWTRSGFLKGSVLVLNPELFNLRMGMLTLDASPSIPKTDIINRLRMLGYIFVINTHVGNWVGLAFLYNSEESRKTRIELITTLCGAADSKFARTQLGPPFRGKLSETDWRILERLQSNVAEPYSTMAGALQISVRTIRRRIRRMVSGLRGHQERHLRVCDGRVQGP